MSQGAPRRPRGKGQPRTAADPNVRYRFTPELWDKWRAARKPDANTAKLRRGIRVMRALLQRPHDSELRPVATWHPVRLQPNPIEETV